MKKPIAPAEWNKLKAKEKIKRVKEFNSHIKEWDKLGVPAGLNDMKNLAIKYQTPIPTAFDKNDKPIFDGYK